MNKFFNFMEKHKIIRNIYISLVLIILALFILAILSWDSILSFILFRDKIEFIIGIGIALAVLLVSIIITFFIMQKFKRR